jgi:hypothetical protein
VAAAVGAREAAAAARNRRLSLQARNSTHHCEIAGTVKGISTSGVAGRRKSTYAVSMTQPDALTTDLFAGTPVASWKQNLDRPTGSLPRSHRVKFVWS